MFSLRNIKSICFSMKSPRDFTVASLAGAGLSILAALSMVFLLGMELSSYLAVSTTTSVVVDKTSDGDLLLLDFNISFPSLPCEVASVEVSDMLGTNELNISKTVHMHPIDSDLRSTGSKFHSGSVGLAVRHGNTYNGEEGEGSFTLNAEDFAGASQEYPLLVVMFYAHWCYWSNRSKPSWEKAAKIMRERYDPEIDGRILIGKVECPSENELCKRNHIQAYPTFRIFRNGSDVREYHGTVEHESYYGARDTESLVKMMEELVASLPSADKPRKMVLAKLTGGCRVEGFVHVKKVPGSLIISVHSGSQSFDMSHVNMSHVISHLTFGQKISQQMLSDAKRIMLMPYIGGSHDRLSGQTFVNCHDVGANLTIEHYIQVVKTEVVTRGNHKLIEEYEFTARSSSVKTSYIPVVKFHYEFSPLQVLITENPKSPSHFVRVVCAIVGVVFVVTGILDSVVRSVHY